MLTVSMVPQALSVYSSIRSPMACNHQAIGTALIDNMPLCPPSTCPCAVQPALYEAFGLTVVEAMTCGLPTFATCNGGPSEIIKNGKSGFHIDPYHGAAVRDDGCSDMEELHAWLLSCLTVLHT